MKKFLDSRNTLQYIWFDLKWSIYQLRICTLLLISKLVFLIPSPCNLDPPVMDFWKHPLHSFWTRVRSNAFTVTKGAENPKSKASLQTFVIEVKGQGFIEVPYRTKFRRTKFSTDKIFDTKLKFRHFCPTNFCRIRYVDMKIKKICHQKPFHRKVLTIS